MTAPQRFLANDRNLIRTATLTPSDVQAVANSVIETQLARAGTAQLKIIGSYSGLDDATYDFEVLDGDTSTKLVSAPVYSGAGSESLADIVATTAAPQTFTVQCHSAGQPAVSASVEVQGVSVIARAPGVAGNAIHINVDISGLVFAPTAFSLIEDVKKGAGSASAPLDGPQYDWATATVGADNNVPAGAHRIAFEGDRMNVYVQYKSFVDGGYKYFFVPELQNDYPTGTQILDVSGSYGITVSNGVSSDVLTGIVTVYDFLNAVKTLSALADVDGIIANDHSPTGQATAEFPLRTQARALLSTGTGSKAATGFSAITVATDANTELVTAECIAIDSTLDPNAFVGHEAWTLKGSVSGALGTIYTGVPFVSPTFGLTIPVKTPATQGNSSGRFSLSAVSYATRTAAQSEVEICFAGKLGPNAVDQTITLVYTVRPPADCNCESMPVPELNTRCLGGAGGDTTMGYSSAAQSRIDGLYDWVSTLAAAVTRYTAGFYSDGLVRSLLPVSSADITGSSTTTLGGTTVTYSTPSGEAGPTISLPNVAFDQEGFGIVDLPISFTGLIDQFDSTLQLIDAITDTGLLAAGFSAWDDAVTAIQGDLNTSELSALNNRLASVASLKYQLMLRRSLAAAGISPVGKSNASTQTSGDGCWRDYGDPFYWKVTGSQGEYAPAFTNHAYWSSRKNDAGIYFSTKEFAFILNVLCPQNLLAGDTITLTIGNAATLGTYQVGDVLNLPLIAAADAFLTGGIDASLVQSWYVSGSVDGAFPVYVFDPGSPAGYSSGGLAFTLVMGGVPPANGDAFTFAIEGAHYRWRKNGGLWNASSPPDAVPAGATVFDDGLSFQFVTGASPSFVADDMWTFRAFQPWSAEKLKNPDRERWFPGVATSNVYAEFASVQTLDSVAIALHTIPTGAVLTLTGGDTLLVTDWTESIAWQAGAIVQFLSETRTALWVQLNISSGADASVGWLWAGVAATTALSADVSLLRNYAIERGSAGGLYQGGAFLGKAVNGTVAWSDGALTESDAAMISALLDWVKSNDDEPFVFVPQVTRPADALFAQVVEDQVELVDMWEYNPDATSARRLSAKLSLQGVWG